MRQFPKPLARVVAVRCGIGPINAARATEAALARWRPRAVLVAGIAGGLQSDIPPGTSVVLDAVRAAQSRRVAAPDLVDALEAALGNAGVTARRGEGWTVDGVADAAAKRQLGANGALTVDSESSSVLERASARGVPAAALRVVADPVDRGVPRSVAALAWIDGAPWWPQALDAWRLPLEIHEVTRFRRDLRLGLAGLRRALPPVIEALTR
jgi:nucleoside phosphorylase